MNTITSEIKKGNSRPFWDYTKSNKKTEPKKILSFKNEEISDTQRIADCFASHFKSAYNPHPSTYKHSTDIESTNTDNFHIDSISDRKSVV